MKTTARLDYSNAKSRTILAIVACTLALLAVPATAQITRVNTVMNNVQLMLASVAVTVFTIMFIWAGFKMGFQHTKWSEISNIIIGGILVGGAAGLASWLIA